MAKIETEFTRMIDVDYPIIGAPMFLISYEELAVAVAEAGGLGAIPLPNFRTTEDLKYTLDKIREKTDKPIGVNIHVSGKFEWEDQLALCLDYGVTFFITSLGDPKLILDDVHANGGWVFADVISVEQGLRARERGVDGLVAFPLFVAYLPQWLETAWATWHPNPKARPTAIGLRQLAVSTLYTALFIWAW